MADPIQGINIPATRGPDYTPIKAPDIGEISTGLFPIPTATEAALLEGTPDTPILATTAVHTTHQLMDVPVSPYAMIPAGIVTPHPVLTSPTGTIQTTPKTGPSLTPATPTTQPKDLRAEKSSNAPDLQHLINPTAPRLPPSRISLQILHQILTVTLII